MLSQPITVHDFPQSKNWDMILANQNARIDLLLYSMKRLFEGIRNVMFNDDWKTHFLLIFAIFL